MAQKEHAVVGLANPTAGKIQLRWSPTSYIAWQIGTKYGYTIERFTLAVNGELVDQPKAVLLSRALKPYTLQQMEPLADKDDRVATVAEVIYGEGGKKAKPEDGIGAYLETKNQHDWKMAMALLSCDLSVDAAKCAGLYFEDTNVKENERYAYRISVAQQPQGLTIDTAFVVASLNDPIKLSPPVELAVVCGDSTATLGWLTTFNKAMYSAYSVERSADGKNFKPVTALPVIPTAPDKNGFSYYQDSLPQNEKIFYYRIRGISPFATYGPYSQIVQGAGVPAATDHPIVDTVIVIDNKKITLRWHISEKMQKQLSKIIILRSANGSDNYESIGQLKASATSFTDEKPLNSNYYRIKAITKAGRAVYSFPYSALLIDSTPPAVPAGLAGKIDSVGVVTLQWNANTEKDLQGYRVFRASSLKEEFVEVTTDIIRKKQAFKDTVNLHTLASKVYYKIIAVDMNYNPSGYSAPLMIKRPDTIAPSQPVITDIHRNDSLGVIMLKWINSSSEDVVKYTLDRICINDNSRKAILQWDTTKKIERFTDTSATLGKTYYYELTAYDDSGNKGKELSGDIWFETGKRPAITDFNVTTDKEKVIAILQWQCVQPDVKQYRIYRSKNNEPFILFATLNGNMNNYTDKELALRCICQYKIIAVLKGDVKTVMSKTVEVKL